MSGLLCGHVELEEDDDVGEGGGHHAGQGAPLYREEAEAREGADAMQFLVNYDHFTKVNHRAGNLL